MIIEELRDIFLHAGILGETLVIAIYDFLRISFLRNLLGFIYASAMHKHFGHTPLTRVGGLVVVVAILVGWYRFFSEDAQVEQELRQRWDYFALANMEESKSIDPFVRLVATLKLWDIDHAYGDAYELPIASAPDWWQMVYKALTLRSKWDRDSAQAILRGVQADDPILTSLFLELRAQLYCEQQRFEECTLLANDSVKLDPLAAYGIGLQAWAARGQWAYAQAHELRKKAEQFDIVATNWVQFNRGLTAFYVRDFQAASGDLSVLTVVQTGEKDTQITYDAMLFMGRIALHLEQYEQANTWFLVAKNYKLSQKKSVRVPDLWTARVHMTQGDYTWASAIYASLYAQFPTVVEIITDALVPAYTLGDQAQVIKLKQQLDLVIGTGIESHLLAAQKMLRLGDIDTATSYMTKADFLLESYPTWDIREQLHQRVRMAWYDVFATSLVQNLQQSGSLAWPLGRLTALAPDSQKTYFFEWLVALLLDKPADAQLYFSRIPGLSTAKDQAYVHVRYLLLTKQPKAALELLTQVVGVTDTDPKTLWMKRALAAYIWDETLATSYVDALRAGGVQLLPESTNKQLWQTAMVSFRPWIDRLLMYANHEYLWLHEPILTLDERNDF